MILLWSLFQFFSQPGFSQTVVNDVTQLNPVTVRAVVAPTSIQEIQELLKEEALKFAKLKRKKIEEADKWDKIDLDVLEKIPKSVRNKMTYFDEKEYNDNTVCAYDKRCSVPNCERKHVPICKNGITCPFLETKTCTN